MDADFSSNCVVLVEVPFINPKYDNETQKYDDHHIRHLKAV